MIRKLTALLLLLPLLSCVDDGQYPRVTVYGAEGITPVYEFKYLGEGGTEVIDPVLLITLDELYPGNLSTDIFRWTDMMLYDGIPVYCSGFKIDDILSADNGDIIVISGKDGDDDRTRKIRDAGILKYDYTNTLGIITPYEYIYKMSFPGKKIEMPLIVFVIIVYNKNYIPPEERTGSEDSGINIKDEFLVDLKGAFCNGLNEEFPASLSEGQYLIVSEYTLTLKKK